MTEQQEYLNGVQAAAYLGVNKQRIYELARTGRIGSKIGGYWLFTLQELDAYKLERAQRPKGGRPKKHADSSSAKTRHSA